MKTRCQTYGSMRLIAEHTEPSLTLFYIASTGGYIMKSIDLTPLYRSSIGFDSLGSMIDTAMRSADAGATYPPYNIESLDENNYAITLAVAGFEHSELDLSVENNVLTVRGQKAKDQGEHNYIYQGIANRAFERKFHLAEHVEVTDANLSNGLLTVSLVREIPEAMKPRSIAITQSGTTLEHKTARRPAVASKEADERNAA